MGVSELALLSTVPAKEVGFLSAESSLTRYVDLVVEVVGLGERDASSSAMS